MRKIGISFATTLKGLLDTLRLFSVEDAETIICFGKDGNPVRLQLFEDTLTDNSLAYSIQIDDIARAYVPTSVTRQSQIDAFWTLQHALNALMAQQKDFESSAWVQGIKTIVELQGKVLHLN